MRGDEFSYCSWKKSRANCPPDYIEYLISQRRIPESCRVCDESCPRYNVEKKLEIKS